MLRFEFVTRRAEGTGTGAEFVVPVNRYDDLDGPVSAQWRVSGFGSDSVNQLDFEGNVYPSGTVSFAAGVSSASIRFRTVGDAFGEPDEGLSISLFAPSAGARLADAATSFYYSSSINTVILDDDGPQFIWQRELGGGLGTFSEPAAIYEGPVRYLRNQFTGSANGESVSGTNNNDFIVLLAGDDACNARQGDDVIDGGSGSNFLNGGSGNDVFFLDGRLGTSTWSTIADWEAGEQVSVWGWRPGVSRSTVVAMAGADGYRGATLHMDLDGNGLVETSVTWTGLAPVGIPAFREYDDLLWLIG